ncbi:MAG: hypothetical protein IJ685_10510 [Selenomonadaceae bacterium]|nr:hypothetical protein [Selenomonadaceae bacterium]
MRKIFLTICVCLLFMTSSANAAILKDDAGFSYVNSYNYLVFTAGATVNGIGGAYDLSSIHILADNNSRFEFNVIVVTFMNRDGSITNRDVANIREDYGTGNIYVNGKPLGNYVHWGKTSREIYYKLKSAALSR